MVGIKQKTPTILANVGVVKAASTYADVADASRPNRQGYPTFPYKLTFKGVVQKKTLTLFRMSGL